MSIVPQSDHCPGRPTEVCLSAACGSMFFHGWKNFEANLSRYKYQKYYEDIYVCIYIYIYIYIYLFIYIYIYIYIIYFMI